MNKRTLQLVILIFLALIIFRHFAQIELSESKKPDEELSPTRETTEIKYTLDIANTLYEGQYEQINSEVRDAFIYVKERFESKITGATVQQPKFTASFGLINSCQSVSGITYVDEHIVQVFTCNQIPTKRAINIIAHEYGHQLEFDSYQGKHYTADLILLEGVATFTAGKYWLGKYATFKEFVRGEYGTDNLLPLATQSINLVRTEPAKADKLYYQWASFVEYLLETYPRENFSALYSSGEPKPGGANYQELYRKSLETLEIEWKDWLTK